MARPSATAAALLLLLFSLVAVAHCRPVDPQSANTDADESTTVVVPTIDDENGPPNPTFLPAEADQVILPAEGFLRLPSHRPCRHGPFPRPHFWLPPRHHRAFDDAPRRFPFHHPVAGEVPGHLPFVHEVREDGESMPVAEPDPDRSLPDGEVEMARMEPSFGEEDGAAVRAWKKEMMRRWFHHHHGMRHHHLHRRDEVHEEEGHEKDGEDVEGSLKRIHHRLHHEDDEEKDAMRKRFRRDAEHHDESDDEEVEEMVRRFRKAIMRRRVGHGHRFHHRQQQHRFGHRHGEEDAQQEGGVVSWFKGIMNRF